MKNIVIIGAGDLGKEIVWLIEDINRIKPTYLILGFLDDDMTKRKKTFYGYDVLGSIGELEQLGEKKSFSAVIAIQDGSVRRRIVEEHLAFIKWESIIHPTAMIASTSSVGIGSIVFPQVTVSVDTKLGAFNLLYIHATVCNDCRLGDWVSVMSGASVSEHAVVGEESFLAAGSCIYPHRRIGRKTKVAVEAVASRDYGDGAEISESHTGFSLFK